MVVYSARECLERGVEDQLFWCQGSGLVEELCVVESVEGWELVLKGDLRKVIRESGIPGYCYTKMV